MKFYCMKKKKKKKKKGGWRKKNYLPWGKPTNHNKDFDMIESLIDSESIVSKGKVK